MEKGFVGEKEVLAVHVCVSLLEVLVVWEREDIWEIKWLNEVDECLISSPICLLKETIKYHQIFLI